LGAPFYIALFGEFHYLSNKKYLAGCTIGFFPEPLKNPCMGIARSSRRGFSFLRNIIATTAALLFAATAFADTPGSLRGGAYATACACQCNEGSTHAGCSKVCDSPRRATRWGATTCAKPRLRKPVDNNGAGPRLPHPPRAERASL